MLVNLPRVSLACGLPIASCTYGEAIAGGLFTVVTNIDFTERRIEERRVMHEKPIIGVTLERVFLSRRLVPQATAAACPRRRRSALLLTTPRLLSVS